MARAGASSASAREAVREARVAVTLAQAVLKGDKMDDVVRDAVMMGVAAIQPVVTARSEVTLQSLVRGRNGGTGGQRHCRLVREAVRTRRRCRQSSNRSRSRQLSHHSRG